MSFIYHLVPRNLKGEVLIPLVELKEKYPEIYASQMAKYDDHPQRKRLPKRMLKKLNCLQEEVLHFSPIHPWLMHQGLQSVFSDWNQPSLFFEIPIQRIRNLPAILFDMNSTGTYVFGEDESEEMFRWLTPENYQILESIPPEAIEFYQKWQERGHRGAPAMARIPHVMVKGRASVQNCRIIDWRHPPNDPAGMDKLLFSASGSLE